MGDLSIDNPHASSNQNLDIYKYPLPHLNQASNS